MEYVKISMHVLFGINIVGPCMHNMNASICQYVRFGAAKSDVAIDRHIRIVHTWPHYNLIPIKTCMENLDVFHAGIDEV